MKKRTRQILTILLLIVAVVSCGQIARKSLDYYKGGQDYAEAVEVAGLELPEDPPPARPQTAPAADPGGEPVPEPEPDPKAAEDAWIAALAQVDLEALRQINGDVVGWIAIPGTVLSYPLVQAGDNSYYLNRTWKREGSSVGAIFLDQAAGADLSGFHTLIYGHRMRNGTMFGSLRHYNREDYWREHPTVYVVSQGQVLLYDIFAAYEVGVREIVYRLDIVETGQQEELIRYALRHSYYDTGIVPTAEDRILTLSTCTGSGHASRWVVQAVLRAPEEAGQ